MGKSKKNREINSKVSLGKRVRYIGLFGASRSCEFCGNTKHNGMFSEYDGKFFCNEECIRMNKVIPSA
jgi:hypothetical protein